MLVWLWVCLPILLVIVFALGLYLGRRRFAMPAPLVLIDDAGHVTQANQAARQTLGLHTGMAETALVDFLPDAVAPLFLYSVNAKAPGIFLDDRREARALVLVPYAGGFAMTICDVDDDSRDLYEPPEASGESIASLEQVLALLLAPEAIALSIGSPPKESLAVKAAVAGKHAAPGPDSPRVLIADDNAVVRTVCGNIVKIAGFVPDFAASGSEAVEKCRTSAYNFVLMDMLMPELDGDDATRAIKSLPPPFGTVRIIAMSGTDSDEMRQKAHESGMDGFIFKPFTFEQLKSVLGCLY